MRSQYCDAPAIDEDFYTETEWLEMYCEEFGTEPAAGRSGAGKAGHSAAPPSSALSGTMHARPVKDSASAHAWRLTASQRKAVIDALAALERELCHEASLDDEAGFWLGSGVPRDLAKVGIKSLGDLVDDIHICGFRWYRRVPRMGVVRARRLFEWLTPIAEAGAAPSRSPSGARRPTSRCYADGSLLVGAWPATSRLPWCRSSTARWPMPSRFDRGPLGPWKPKSGARRWTSRRSASA